MWQTWTPQEYDEYQRVQWYRYLWAYYVIQHQIVNAGEPIREGEK